MIDLFNFKPGFHNADGNCLPYQELWNGTCVPKCVTGQVRDSAGICRTAPTGSLSEPTIGFDWIGLQITSNGVPVTAIHSLLPHGRKVGDRIEVKVNSGTWKHSGIYEVLAISDLDDGSYSGSLLVINQVMQSGLTASGVWRPVTTTGTTLTPRGGSTPVDTNCNSGYTKVNGVCVKNTVTNACPSDQEKVNGVCVAKCPTGQVRVDGVCQTPDPGTNDCPTGYAKLGGECVKIDVPADEAGFLSNLPSWAKWVALAAGAGILLIVIFKRH